MMGRVHLQLQAIINPSSLTVLLLKSFATAMRTETHAPGQPGRAVVRGKRTQGWIHRGSQGAISGGQKKPRTHLLKSLQSMTCCVDKDMEINKWVHLYAGIWKPWSFLGP